jgi:hypothetical protein
MSAQQLLVNGCLAPAWLVALVNAQVCSVSGTFGDRTPVYTGTYLSNTHVCGSAACRTTFIESMQDGYTGVTGRQLDSGYSDAAIDCWCASKLHMTPTGVTTWELEEKRAACSDPTCRERVLAAGSQNSGANMRQYCEAKSLNCPGGLKDRLTDCMCSAATTGWHYWWRPPSRGTEPLLEGDRAKFCSIRSCSIFLDALIDSGLQTEPCPPIASMGAIVGGVVGGLCALICACYAVDRRSRPHPRDDMKPDQKMKLEMKPTRTSESKTIGV